MKAIWKYIIIGVIIYVAWKYGIIGKLLGLLKPKAATVAQSEPVQIRNRRIPPVNTAPTLTGFPR